MTPEIISNPLPIPPIARRAVSGAADPRYEIRPKGKGRLDRTIARRARQRER